MGKEGRAKSLSVHNGKVTYSDLGIKFLFFGFPFRWCYAMVMIVTFGLSLVCIWAEAARPAGQFE